MLLVLSMWATMAKDHVSAFTSRIADDRGQDFIEYALILGVISLIIIFAFLTTDINSAVTNLSKQVACELAGNNWDKATTTCTVV